MQNNENYAARGKHVFMNTYNRFPITFVKGDGVYLTDADGKEYLDFVSGIAVNSLGYNNKNLNEALKAQIDQLYHVSNLYYNIPAVELGEMMTSLSGFEKVFFCNSGAEAVESSLKLARMYGAKFKSNQPSKVIAMLHSFHGRTYGAVSATGQLKYQQHLGGLVPNIVHVPFNDYDALLKEVDDTVCCILLEPIQGEGGILPADKEYLQKVRALCDENDILLMFDEVQCGIGRTGYLFAYEYFGVKPDTIAMAKGLGGGFPIGAMLANAKAEKAFEPGNHASTFGGNALAASAGKAVLSEIQEKNLLENVKKQGELLKTGLIALKEKYGIVKDVRGVGLMLGMECSQPVKEIISECIEQGLLLVNAGESIIRFVPPLIIGESDIQKCLEILDGVLAKH
ncbi:MAG: aspartate aminotransferase family protein [Anaerofustis sp.]